MGRTIHVITLKRDAGQKWGFGISGGKDCALTFRIEKVSLSSPAGQAGKSSYRKMMLNQNTACIFSCYDNKKGHDTSSFVQ